MTDWSELSASRGVAAVLTETVAPAYRGELMRG